MPTMPFADPFGLAWLGFLIWAIIIIAIAWVLLMFSVPIIAFFTLSLRIITLPLYAIFGKKKQSMSNIKKSGKSASKSLFKMKVK